MSVEYIKTGLGATNITIQYLDGGKVQLVMVDGASFKVAGSLMAGQIIEEIRNCRVHDAKADA